MCGIGGIVAELPGAELNRCLAEMAQSMAHRGPDDSGIWTAAAGRRRVGVCATRLAIQDTSARGHQPMVSAATGNCLVFNGEIYNPAELRDELARLGHSFVGNADTEVVLAAWDAWGEQALDRLRGMFALGVWEPSRERFVLARDGLGIGPKYMAMRASVRSGSNLPAIVSTALSGW